MSFLELEIELEIELVVELEMEIEVETFFWVFGLPPFDPFILCFSMY